MVSVRTDILRNLAEILRKEAVRQESRGCEIRKITHWVGNQEFEQKEKLQNMLLKQCTEIFRQANDLMILAEALRCICEKYDITEHVLVQKAMLCRCRSVLIDSIRLRPLKNKLDELGISMSEL